MEEEKRAKGRGSSEKRYFNLLWLLFSSIQRDNRYIAMINREIDFVLGGLTRRRERQRPSRVDCSQSEQKREIAFLIVCIHARLARHSVWANRCQRPILPFSVFLPAKSRAAKPRNFHFVWWRDPCRGHFDYDLANNSLRPTRNRLHLSNLSFLTRPAILLKQGS